MSSLRQLEESTCWHVSGVRDAETFFRAIGALVPNATDVFLEGSPNAEIVALMRRYVEATDYAAPAATLWSWPQQNRRFRLRASPELFARFCEAAAHRAEPEICSHLHFYCGPEPLVNWFDAFDDPVLVSKAIPRDRVEQFCRDVGGVLSDDAA